MNIDEKMQQVLKSTVLGGISYGNTFLEDDIKKMISINIPNQYISFIQKYGVGQLADTFLLDFEILPYYEIFDREDDIHLEGMYFFASDLGEYLFAFDSKNDWQIVEIDSSGEIFNIVSNTFNEFINEKLNELIEIEKWRKKNSL